MAEELPFVEVGGKKIAGRRVVNTGHMNKIRKNGQEIEKPRYQHFVAAGNILEGHFEWFDGVPLLVSHEDGMLWDARGSSYQDLDAWKKLQKIAAKEEAVRAAIQDGKDYVSATCQGRRVYRKRGFMFDLGYEVEGKFERESTVRTLAEALEFVMRQSSATA